MLYSCLGYSYTTHCQSRCVEKIELYAADGDADEDELVLALLRLMGDFFIDRFAPCWPVCGLLSLSLFVLTAQKRRRLFAVVPELAIIEIK